MVTYASSKFLTPSALDLDEAAVEQIYSSVNDLKAVNKQTTPAEMQRLLDEHFFNLTTGSVVEDDSDDEYAPIRNEKPSSIKKNAEVIESVFEEAETPFNPVVNKISVKEEINETDESTDEALKKLLADL
jgi:hypothetical protein